MFDPPHLGHLILACEAAWQLDLDEVLLMPTARPPHRGPGWLDPELRLRLVAAAVEGHPALSASRRELDRPGPSWSADTVVELRAAAPDAALWLLMGADQLASFGTWRAPERIVASARLGVVSRDGATLQIPDVAAGAVDAVTMPEIAISSSLIRERIRTGAPIAHLVPGGVCDILAEAGVPRPPSALP